MVKTMKYGFAAFLLSLLTLSCSQGFKHSIRNAGAEINKKDCSAAAWGQGDGNKDTSRARLRRLESVTWDSVKHQLRWDISKGEEKENGYQPQSTDRYEINMDKATMTVNGKSRRFSEDEAANVRTLMDFISKYAVESTVWWENGEGEPVDGKEAPTKPDKPKPEDRNKERVVRVVAMQVAAK